MEITQWKNEEIPLPGVVFNTLTAHPKDSNDKVLQEVAFQIST